MKYVLEGHIVFIMSDNQNLSKVMHFALESTVCKLSYVCLAILFKFTNPLRSTIWTDFGDI